MTKILWIFLFLYLIHNLLPAFYFKFIYDEAHPRFGIDWTFDDGPDGRTTPKFLDLLEEKNLDAIFFLIGEKVEKNPDLARLISKKGQRVGFHCYRHYNPLFRGPVFSYLDFKRGLEALRGEGVRATYYRPPHGAVNLTLYLCARENELTLKLYNEIPGDWRAQMTYDELKKSLEAAYKKGAVVCLHDANDRLHGPSIAPLRTLQVLEDFLEEDHD